MLLAAAGKCAPHADCCQRPGCGDVWIVDGCASTDLAIHCCAIAGCKVRPRARAWAWRRGCSRRAAALRARSSFAVCFTGSWRNTHTTNKLAPFSTHHARRCARHRVSTKHRDTPLQSEGLGFRRDLISALANCSARPPRGRQPLLAGNFTHAAHTYTSRPCTPLPAACCWLAWLPRRPCRRRALLQ